MNSSQPQSLLGGPSTSSENVSLNFAVMQQQFAGSAATQGLPGSYDDASVVRSVLIEVIKRCGLSRESIADRMSYLLGRQVTEAMLNAFTAESRNDRRWPAEFDRAFCEATGDDSLIRCRAERAGLTVITAAEVKLLELGRQHLAQKQATAAIARLEAELAGVNIG